MGLGNKNASATIEFTKPPGAPKITVLQVPESCLFDLGVTSHHGLTLSFSNSSCDIMMVVTSAPFVLADFHGPRFEDIHSRDR